MLNLTHLTIRAARLYSSPQVVVPGQVRRCLSTHTDGEVRIATILKEKFPLASSLKVVDISGRRR